jgi:uncharacterized damage-inducible protein DinB
MLDLFNREVAPALSLPLAQLEAAFARLGRIVQGMSQEALDYRGPTGDQNSTAMLICHLAQVDLDYLHGIMGAPVPDELRATYGDYQDEHGKIPVVAGRSATELLDHYGRVIERVRAYLQGTSDEEASRSVAIPWWPQPATVRYLLWHMATHSIHHQAQIMRLKEAFAQRSHA